LIVLKIRA